jgi:hypothetical protein
VQDDLYFFVRAPGSACSIRRRIASEREVTPLAAAHASIALVKDGDARSPIIGSRPVAGRPRFCFLGLAVIDFAMNLGLA